MDDSFYTASGDPEASEHIIGSASATDRHVRSYDFKHPKLVSKEIMRALRNIHELLSRNLNRIFTDSLNQKVEVTLKDIDEVIFSEFLSELEQPTALFLFNIEELGDWALMELDPSFCLYCIERQGGSREETTKPPRALTRIEERVISRIIDKIFKELSHVWAPYLNITILNHVYESKPANIRTISSHIPGIIIRYEIRVENLMVPFKICYPYALLKEQMNNSFHEPDKSSSNAVLNKKEKKAFEDYMKQVSVPLNVILGEVDISMEQLINIEEGDTIKLNQSIDDPLGVLVNGTKKMVGYPGNMSGNKAIKVYDVKKSLNPNEEL